MRTCFAGHRRPFNLGLRRRYRECARLPLNNIAMFQRLTISGVSLSDAAEAVTPLIDLKPLLDLPSLRDVGVKDGT